jgi:uncharacterized protein
LFLPKGNRLFTRKRDSATNHKDAQTAGREAGSSEAADLQAARERCLMPYVRNAGRRLPYRSNQTWKNRFIARIAIKNETGDDMSGDILYFSETGKINTARALAVSKKRALELGIKQILVATSHGNTAKEAAMVFQDTGIKVIAVSISEGYRDEGWCMSSDQRQELEKVGVRVLTSHLGLSGGVAESFLGDNSPGSIAANTLYCFSQGMKVAVEITIMAAEAGYVSDDREIIAVAGTGEGADTAIVLVPVYARRFKDLRVREILCKPRIG